MEKWNLPDGWDWVRLGDARISEVIMGQSPPGNTYNRAGNGLPFYQGKTDFGKLSPTPQQWCTQPSKIAEAGDILISVRAPVGPTNICIEKSAIGRGLAALRPKMTETKYLLFALRNIEPLIAQKGQGSTFPAIGKAILNDIEIPIPYPDNQTRSLETQRRIVARLEALLAEVQETRQLRCSILDDANLLGRAIFFRGEWEATMQRMGELVSQKPLDVIVNNETEYLFAGVKSFGRGVFPSKSKKGFETSYRQLTRLSTGDFTYPKLMAWEGALGIVPPECDGMVVSPEFPVFQVHTEKILPEVLDVYFKTPAIWGKLAELSTGSNARRRRLHPNAFFDYEFPVPPKHIQQQVYEAHVFLTEYQKSYNEDENSLGILEQSFLAQAFRGEL